jgi:ankyrin repeat protein
VAGATALLSKDGQQMGSTAITPAKDSSGTKLSKHDINKRDAQGRTVLHLAASKGSLDFVRALLENLATDINLLDTESGW